MKKLNFAIFGCGVIAKFHAAALKDVENAELIGCSDVYLPAAEIYASERGIKVYESFDALLEAPEVDVVNICTPNGTHADLAIKALEAGKNVVLEKPMAITAADCDRIIEAAKKSGGKITVISQLRTSPDILRTRDLIRSGELGRLVYAELLMRYYRAPEYYKGSWRGTKKMDGGGAFMNQGIHGVDIVQFLMGPVKNVKSIVRTLSHDIEVEDMAVVAVEYENGALGTMVASTSTHPGFDRDIKIHGTRGAVELREGQIVRLVIDGKDLPCEEFISSGAAQTNTALDHAGHARQLSTFVRVINGEDLEYVNEYEGKKAVEIIERIYNESI